MVSLYFPFVNSTYYGNGMLHWSESADGVKTFYYYTAEGALSHTIVDLDGDLSTTHDQMIGEVTIYDEYGRVHSKILDTDGNLSTVSDQISTRFEYDNIGRIVKTIYADGTFTSCSYDNLGRKISETNQSGLTTYYEYDHEDRITAVILPQVAHPISGEMVHVRYEYLYNTLGKQIALRDNIFQTDPLDASTINLEGMRETFFTYDWQGNQTSRTLPDGSIERFFYNEYGRQIRHISFEGRVTHFEYDNFDRLSGIYYYTSEIAWNGGNGDVTQSVIYTRDLYGRIIEEIDSKTGTTYTAYDVSGNIVRVSSPSGTINYEYDSVTGLVTRTWTGSNSTQPNTDIRNTYDKLGRLETVSTYAREGSLLSIPETSQYIYDLIGNLDKIINANGVISDYNYDELNRLKDLTHYKPDATPEDLSDNEVLQKYSYNYHQDGNKARETFTDGAGETHTWDWVYDQLGRLIRETHDNSVDTLDYDIFYKYDLVGNRLEKAIDTNLNGVIDEVVRSQFDTNDRLLNEMKLFNGQQTERTDYLYNKTEQIAKTVTNLLTSRVETKTTMTYNEQGRMSSLVVETFTNGLVTQEVKQEYTYDSAGIKVRQVELLDANADGNLDATKDTTYLNDAKNHTGYSQILEERIHESGKELKVTTYTVGHDVLAQSTHEAGYLALLADGHGSTRGVTDKTGCLLQEYSFDAYGNAHGFLASEALTNLLYSGEQFNPVSGLQYLRARWYNPQNGRFNRLDPYAGNQLSPLSFHKYSYAHLNPVMGTDPSGLMNMISLMAGLGISSNLRANLIHAQLNVAELVVQSLFVILMGHGLMQALTFWPDALSIGGNLTVRLPIPRFSVDAGFGAEAQIGLRTGQMAAFVYPTANGQFSQNRLKGMLPSAYVGLVFNAPNSSASTGPSMYMTAGFDSIPSSIRMGLRSMAAMINAVGTVYGTGSEAAAQKAYDEMMNYMDNLENVFISVSYWFNAAMSFSLGKSFSMVPSNLNSSSKFSYGASWYFQVLPWEGVANYR